nr:immunoglobulin light chain junction region [Macaca mulatta]MPN81565.1 immunoglobulin light chain junction region [Macaca mulatta]MPN81583.1 immunoglobulin light chain junction region [Macaca mulatta]MPN81588.1 immunoglobulin light chain junction region [Macaca mulatta]MPN81590.1 immunoglobulin light chain junction region [Macaca mulatta]
CLQGYSSPSSF